jgi:putative transposase
MKGWFTLREIVALSLPGLPASERGIYRFCETEQWALKVAHDGQKLSRVRKGRDGGGGTEYHISLLPQAARAALSAQATKIDSLELVTPARLLEPLMEAPAHASDALRIDSRMAVLSMADAFFSANFALGRKGADADFCARYNNRELAVDQWIADAVSTVSVRSLFRWRQDRESGRWHAIGGKGRRDKSLLEQVEDGDVAGFIGGLLAHQPFLSAAQVRDIVEAKFGSELRHGLGVVPLPVERSFQRFITQFKKDNATSLLKINDPDAYKSRVRFAGSNAYSGITQLNELWEIDASPADMLCKDGRYAIYVLIDVYSRRMMSYVTKNPRTEASLLLLRKAILAWGVPETLRTDNGSDFTSHAFKRGVTAVGIIHDVTRAFSPEEKGIVERAIGTMQRGLMTLLPGFVGHSVADRKVIEARKAFAARLGESPDKAFCVELTHTELQTYMDRWCEDKYAHHTHDTLKTTPFLKAQSWRGVERRISNSRTLDLLLAPVSGGMRVVTKRGIQLDGAYYFSGALLAGARVFCRQDPEDMGKLYVFADEMGEFLCEAICPERAGVDPRQAVAMARAEQSRIVKEGTKELRAAAKAIKPRDMIDAVLDLAGRKSASITAFPRRSETYSTGAIEQAEIALDGQFEKFSNADQITLDAPTNVVRLSETPKQRFSRAMAVKQALAMGGVIDAEQVRWFGNYETTAEYKSHVSLFEEHGREWLNA